MWATHPGLSKSCENRTSYPSPALGFFEIRRCQDFLSGLHLQVQEIAEQDWLLAILASAAEAHDLAKTSALGTALLAEGAAAGLPRGDGRVLLRAGLLSSVAAHA